MEVVGGGEGRKRGGRKIDPSMAGAPTQGDPQSGMQMQLRPEDMEDVVCSHCGGQFFRPVVMLKRIKAMLIGAPKDQLAPVQVMRCDDCGTPLEDMIPKMPKNGEENE